MEEIFYLKLNKEDAWYYLRAFIEGCPMVAVKSTSRLRAFWFKNEIDAHHFRVVRNPAIDRIAIVEESEVIPESEYVKP